MNYREKILLELIKQSQFKNGSIPTDNCDYSAVLMEARQQSLLGLISPLIPADVYPQDNKWKNINERQKASFILYLHEQNNLIQILRDAGIHFAILKGCASAMYYLNPALRSMGDIDVLVGKNDYSRAKTLLLSNGYEFLHKEDERNIPLKKNGIVIELHRQFSSPDKDIECYIREGLLNCEIHSIDGFSFPTLSKMSNGIVLLDHMRQHLKGGLGLRQVVDWMMYVNAELDDEFWNEEFGNVAKEIGLEQLALVVTKMCTRYLGLSNRITWCLAAEDEVCDLLLQNLFASGNFGTKLGKGQNVESISTAINNEGFFFRLQHTGERNWKAYKKHHWLKPFCWIYQGVRYIGKGIKTGRTPKQLLNDARRGKDRADLLKKLGIN